MIDVVPTGPWTAPLNWNLCATYEGEICTPFTLYVQPDTTCLDHVTFPQFQQLPVELQLHVLLFCDDATLFQLTHVSHVLRNDARKLFWSAPDAWYRIDGHWLFSGGLPAGQHYAMDFLANLQQLEVDFHHMRCFWEEFNDGLRTEGHNDDLSWDFEKRIHAFWQVLQWRFPRVVRIVISESVPRRAGAPLPDDLKMIALLCPPGISTLVSVLRCKVGDSGHATRHLVQHIAGKDGETEYWKLINTTWTRQIVLLPPKHWRGPVGAYLRLRYKLECFKLMNRAATCILLLAAIEQHQLSSHSGLYTCPGPVCEAQFMLPGQWALHAVDTQHRCFAVPPAQYQALFDEREQRLERFVQEEFHQPIERLRNSCGQAGSRQRQDTEQAFLFQLEHDPEYAHSKPGRECSTWIRYTRDVYEYARDEDG
jgi:hypothetical protein